MKTILVDAWETFVVKDKGIDQDLYQLLEQYPNPKIILTNANDEQQVKYGLVNLPYQLFTLNHEPDKVDPEYFKKMLQHFNIKIEDVVYFDHAPEAVQSAESIGIKSYFFDAVTRDLIALKAFLDENLKEE